MKSAMPRLLLGRCGYNPSRSGRPIDEGGQKTKSKKKKLYISEKPSFVTLIFCCCIMRIVTALYSFVNPTRNKQKNGHTVCLLSIGPWLSTRKHHNYWTIDLEGGETSHLIPHIRRSLFLNTLPRLFILKKKFRLKHHFQAKPKKSTPKSVSFAFPSLPHPAFFYIFPILGRGLTEGGWQY